MASNSKIALIVALVVIAAVVAITVPLVLNNNKSNNNSNEAATNQQLQNSLDKGTDGDVSSPVSAPAPSSNNTTTHHKPPTRSPTATTTTASGSTSAPVSSPPVSTPTTTPLAPTETPTIATADVPTLPPVPAGTVQSFTTASGIDYYHCVGAAPDTTTSTPHHIFLLHGASFERGVWVDDTDILANFCDTPGVRVSALDLPVYANYQQLQTVIDQVAAQQQQQQSSSLITTKPVVLVTPSASGYSVVSWMLTDNANGVWADIPNYIETWVPVAPVALSSATDDEITGSFGGTAAVPVLAIYGDEDSGGQRLSERLGSVVGATVVELSGGHPVYLQSEQEFVQTILDFIK